MSSKDPYVTSIPSMIPSSPKTSQHQSILSPSNNETSHVYLQGLSRMEIQVNANIDTSSSKDLKIPDPMPSCTPIPKIPTLESPIRNASPSCKNMNTFQESSMHINNITSSLEMASCQDDNLKNEKPSPIINQDQDTKTPQSHVMIEKDPISLESHDDPLIPFHLFQDDPFPSQEKNIFPNPIPNPLPKQDHDASSTFSNDPIQNEESNTLPTLSNGPLPCQDQSIPSSPCHNPPCSPQGSIMPTNPSHDRIILYIPFPPHNGLTSSS